MSTETPTDPPDEAWTGDRAARWLRQVDGLERQLEPVSDVLFAAAGLRPGELVLDVGCGTGPTTRRAATLVGPSGEVTGLDVSSEMLERAAATDAPDGAAAIEWLKADAATWDPPEGAYDAVISRFGVMFFDDPGAAFAHLAEATRPGGRLAIAVWARRDRSPLFEVPLRAALDVLTSHDLPVPDGIPYDGGPFSLGDTDAARALLTDAGWSDPAAHPHRLDLPFGGGLPPDRAAEAAADFGPTRIVLDALDDETRRRAVGTIAEALASHTDADGHVVLAGEPIILTATR